MRATILAENYARMKTTFLAEHGFSLYIEDDGMRILYDTGASDVFIKNAEKLAIDLKELDYVIISHGHSDHSGGVPHLIRYYEEHGVYRRPVMLLSEPRIFLKRRVLHDRGLGGAMECSFKVDPDILKKYFQVRFEPGPFYVTKRLLWLGKPDRLNSFEGRVPQEPRILIDGKWEEDFVDEDAQLAYVHTNGDVSILSGCSHSGLCNIIEYAKKVTGAKNVDTFLGGMHLQSPPEEVLVPTIEYIKQENVKRFYACHDIDIFSKIRLIAVSNFEEAGVATSVYFD